MGNSGNNDYTLVQSNNVTYDPRGSALNNFPCQIFNLSDADQFTAPAGSVVGLYITKTLLLHTNTDSSITNYQFSGNQSSVSSTGNSDVNYNIAIRVHLGKNYKKNNVKVCFVILVYVYIIIMHIYSVCVCVYTHNRFTDIYMCAYRC